MIELTKDKIIYSNEYNPESDKYIKKEVSRLWPYFNEVVELSDDFTLEDLFYHIEQEKYIFDLVFNSHLGHFSLQKYIDEINKPGVVRDDKISYLELRRYGEYTSWKDRISKEWGIKSNPEIELFLDFSGVGKQEDVEYAIEFMPLNELKHLPLKLNKKFNISEIRFPCRIIKFLVRVLKYISFSRWGGCNSFGHTYVEGDVNFTVYELFSTVLNEISFMGTPEQRDAQLVKIQDIVKESTFNGIVEGESVDGI